MNLPEIRDGEDKSSALKNCIRNHYRHVRKWAKRTNTNCFRIYDRHIKEYPLAIDYYDGQYCIQYFTDRDEEVSEEFQNEVEQSLCELFGCSNDAIHTKTRIRRRKTEQYEKVAGEEEFFPVVEYGVKFLINLHDYLDTGLFLDHRETRQMVASMAKGKRLLNLFAYTCSFSVHAAVAGASFTKSVDLSNTYTAWGRENFEINDLPEEKNEIVRADCIRFLDQERGRYDLIVIDPPTLSRSKMMDDMFDVQRDYIDIISKALRLLNKDGTIFFSTNSRKFRFDDTLFNAEDITEKTIPIDFHNKKIHRCWKITHKQ